MSDVQITTPDPVVPASTGSEVAGAIIDYQAKYQSEVQDRIRERNLLRPAKQLLDGLDDDQRQAMLSIAEMARNGDNEGIIDWALQTATNLSGGDLAAVIAKRQAAGTTGQTTPGAPPAAVLGQDDINRIIQERLAELVPQQVTQQQAIADGRRYVAGVLTEAGFPPDSPHAATIVRYCQQNQVDPVAGVAWYKGELARYGQTQAQAAAGAAAQVALPQVAPAGAAAAGSPATEMSRRERIMQHLAQQAGV